MIQDRFFATNEIYVPILNDCEMLTCRVGHHRYISSTRQHQTRCMILRAVNRRERKFYRLRVVPDVWYKEYVLRSEEHTSELQSLMRISYAVFCLKKKIITIIPN